MKNRDMMARIQQMQAKLMKAQEELSAATVEGSAGGGAVKVVVTGGLKLQSVKIDPEVVDPGDVEMLEDLVLAAVTEALDKAQALQAQSLGGLTGGMGLPGLR